MAAYSQRAALNGALYALKQLLNGAPCEPGHLDTEEPCPHTAARIMLTELTDDPPRPPYTRKVLLAVLRGLVFGEEAHILVSCGGHTHQATLEPVAELPPGDPFQFAAVTTCGRRISPLNPDDVLEVDIHEAKADAGPSEILDTPTPGPLDTAKIQGYAELMQQGPWIPEDETVPDPEECGE